MNRFGIRRIQEQIEGGDEDVRVAKLLERRVELPVVPVWNAGAKGVTIFVSAYSLPARPDTMRKKGGKSKKKSNRGKALPDLLGDMFPILSR